VFERGDRSLLEVFPGRQLDNPYSMNVADICPVGALTTKDFRFKIRVWFLEDRESVCDQCSNGCNLYASVAHNKVYRYLPRRNDSVNGTWICDHGRLSYGRIREGRLSEPSEDGHPTTYAAAIWAAGRILREALEGGRRIVGVASPFAANEDLFVLRRLLEALGAWPGVFDVERGASDDLLIKAEKAPNAAGARLLGFEETTDSLGRAGAAIVLGHSLPPEALEEVDSLVVLDTHASRLSERASVAIPCRHTAEKAGTFTNHAGRVQRFLPVIEPHFECEPEGAILSRIAAAASLEGFETSYDPFEVSKRLAEEVSAFSGIHLAGLDDQGREVR
jgi:NADH-quinone oxidoreductase subunit G